MHDQILVLVGMHLSHNVNCQSQSQCKVSTNCGIISMLPLCMYCITGAIWPAVEFEGDMVEILGALSVVICVLNVLYVCGGHEKTNLVVVDALAGVIQGSLWAWSQQKNSVRTSNSKLLRRSNYILYIINDKIFCHLFHQHELLHKKLLWIPMNSCSS